MALPLLLPRQQKTKLMFINTALTLVHGRTPTVFQVAATWVAFVSAGGVVLWNEGVSLAGVILALFAADWTAGIVANSAEPVRAWWREHQHYRLPFHLVHLVLLAIAFLIGGDGVVFQALIVILFVKLTVFELGQTQPAA